jgi:hypothetical protein
VTRIVIAGSSVSLFVVPREERSEGTYGELLPDLLGGDIDVRHVGKWFQHVRELRRDYELSVRNHFPDVLVLHFGFVDSQPRVVPTWVARHFQSWDRSPNRAALAYRDSLAPTLWRGLRKVQQSTAGWPTHRVSPGHYVEELRRIITMARAETGCLVLVLDIDPPGPRYEHWVPGMGDRIARYRTLQQDLVDELADPLVRVVPLAHHAREHGLDAILPDGIHRSPLGHRLAAEAIAKEVTAWRAT